MNRDMTKVTTHATSNAATHGLPYSPSPYSLPPNQGPKAPSIGSVVEGERAKTDGDFVAGFGGES